MKHAIKAATGRLCLVALIATEAGGMSASAQRTNSVARIVDELFNRGWKNADVSLIQPAMRDKVIQEIKRRMATGKPRRNSEALAFLVDLRDDAAIETVFEECSRASRRANPKPPSTPAAANAILSFDRSFLNRSVLPRFVSALAADLFIDERAEWIPLGGGLSKSTRSARAASLIWAALANSEAFPKDVRDWARGIYIADLEGCRTQLRAWWKENEECIKQRKYSKVKPLAAKTPTPKESLKAD